MFKLSIYSSLYSFKRHTKLCFEKRSNSREGKLVSKTKVLPTLNSENEVSNNPGVPIAAQESLKIVLSHQGISL